MYAMQERMLDSLDYPCSMAVALAALLFALIAVYCIHYLRIFLASLASLFWIVGFIEFSYFCTCQFNCTD